MSPVFDSQAFFLANIPPESTASRDPIMSSPHYSCTDLYLTISAFVLLLFVASDVVNRESLGILSTGCLLVDCKPSFASRATSQADLNRTVHEILIISDKLSSFHAFLNSLNSYIDWSDPAQTQKVFFGLIYLFPFWVLINWFIPLTWIFIITVTSFLVWNSPWLRVIRSVLMQSPLFRGIISFILGFMSGGGLKRQGGRFSVGDLIRRAMDQQKKLALKRTSIKDNTKTTTDLIFKFVLYENQRWWLGLDWTSNLFPNERPAWSDEYQEPTNNKDSFQLPPPTTNYIPTTEDPNALIQKTMEWQWTDPEWAIDFNGDVDKEGWEYYDNRWKSPSSKSGFRKYTRCRKWVRAAKLVETVQKIQKTKSVSFEEPESEKNEPANEKNDTTNPTTQNEHYEKLQNPEDISIEKS
ncbi:2349_t:CDS:2 [Acaulospora colombiana]|uniref:2349_t:CDS:1 n=1 Tax=Acaulospora colombiana TaxID=27376 RepID=A0ACA9KMK4_9GLOM|nr:2349_t:CDS:2 [Acaulospora colombiana]